MDTGIISIVISLISISILGGFIYLFIKKENQLSEILNKNNERLEVLERKVEELNNLTNSLLKEQKEYKEDIKSMVSSIVSDIVDTKREEIENYINLKTNEIQNSIQSSELNVMERLNQNEELVKVGLKALDSLIDYIRNVLLEKVQIQVESTLNSKIGTIVDTLKTLNMIAMDVVETTKIVKSELEKILTQEKETTEKLEEKVNFLSNYLSILTENSERLDKLTLDLINIEKELDDNIIEILKNQEVIKELIKEHLKVDLKEEKKKTTNKRKKVETMKIDIEPLTTVIPLE